MSSHKRMAVADIICSTVGDVGGACERWAAFMDDGRYWWIDPVPEGLQEGDKITIDGHPDDQFCRVVPS